MSRADELADVAAALSHDKGANTVEIAAGVKRLRGDFRTDELLLFIARGFEARLAALEAAR